MSISLTYDPRFHTFESWAVLMTEAYASQQLQIPNEALNWQEWAVGMSGIDIFANQGMPNPYQYDNWQTWAEHTINIINSPKDEGNNIILQ
jgi:hypothetical protein